MDRLAVGGWRLAVLTPLPPARTGVAHYASMLLPALRNAVGSVDAFDSLDDWTTGRLDDYDYVIYQLGNNPHHELIYAEAMKRPGIVVLHDLVLHHLIVEMTLARGDADAYVAALEANHGAPGAAWARGRAAGLHSEMGNFLLPASVEVAQRAQSVIVHNQYAHDRLRSFGVTTLIHVVPHPYVPETRVFDRGTMFSREQRVIGFFGFLTSAKRVEVVLEAFRIARAKDPRLALLIVGEPAPNIDASSFASDGVVMTGYVADDDFPRYYAVADRFVNLRYPSAGETSGTLIRALDAGKPVAVSDYAQFAELPDDVVFKVPLGVGEVERLVEFFTSDLPDPSEKQRAWLKENAALEKTVEGYLRALDSVILSRVDGEGSPAVNASRAIGRGSFAVYAAQDDRAALPLFPSLEVVSADPLVIKNIGDATIRTRVYGEPEYRLIVKWLVGEVVVHDQWLALPKDLHPGETTEIELPRRKADTLRLYHAMQDVPMLEPEPWETVRVR
ncbi:MAG TPA: glycosyltransferase [Thermoanaerobaculia bacterium]|jgi:glycosyltransferase involved in cell wall biosynthesis|nr:glycosyltransferase [Thermoanaerobaculia bacterium]